MSAAYKKKFAGLQKLRKQLEDLVQQETQARKELDYVQFQFNELDEANIQAGDLQKLEDESETLENSEAIKSALVKSSAALSAGDENIIAALSQVKQQVQSISKFGKQFAELFERVNSAIIDLKELAGDIDRTEEDVVYDPARLEEVNAQLDKLNRLLKKHGVATEEELLSVKLDIEQKLQQFSSLEEAIEKNTQRNSGNRKGMHDSST